MAAAERLEGRPESSKIVSDGSRGDFSKPGVSKQEQQVVSSRDKSKLYRLWHTLSGHGRECALAEDADQEQRVTAGAAKEDDSLPGSLCPRDEDEHKLKQRNAVQESIATTTTLLEK